MQMPNDTASHACEYVSKVSDPKAQALFETTAEVLKGLVKAFDDFEQKREQAWKAAQFSMAGWRSGLGVGATFTSWGRVRCRFASSGRSGSIPLRHALHRIPIRI
jgi:hypothetical protein